MQNDSIGSEDKISSINAESLLLVVFLLLLELGLVDVLVHDVGFERFLKTVVLIS